MKNNRLRFAVALLLAVHTAGMLWVTSHAQAQSEVFYKDKTVRVIVGFTPGGFYDRWARMLARYMPKYIPGNPSFLVQNMPGASSVIAASHVPPAKPEA